MATKLKIVYVIWVPVLTAHLKVSLACPVERAWMIKLVLDRLPSVWSFIPPLSKQSLAAGGIALLDHRRIGCQLSSLRSVIDCVELGAELFEIAAIPSRLGSPRDVALDLEYCRTDIPLALQTHGCTPVQCQSDAGFILSGLKAYSR